MIRRRQRGSANWSRGIFAAFWILLGCLSGLYLFNILTDPALSARLTRLTPAGSSETTATTGGNASPKDQLAAIEENLRALSQQVANLSGKIEESNTSGAPEPAEAAAPEAPAETESAAAEPPAPPEAKEAQPVQAEAPKPAASPEPEAKPTEQAALEQSQTPPPAAAPATPPQPTEPPSVAVAPLENLPPELRERTENKPDAAAEPPAEPAPAPAGAPTATPAATPPEQAASKPQEPAAAKPPATETAALDPIQLPPAANDGSTRYGIEIGIVAKQDGLRPLWREYLTNHAALVAGLQPRRVLAPDKKWRLIAGPFTSAEEAAQACALFKKASRPCEATVYAGDSL